MEEIHLYGWSRVDWRAIGSSSVRQDIELRCWRIGVGGGRRVGVGVGIRTSFPANYGETDDAMAGHIVCSDRSGEATE